MRSVDSRPGVQGANPPEARRVSSEQEALMASLSTPHVEGFAEAAAEIFSGRSLAADPEFQKDMDAYEKVLRRPGALD